MKPLFVILFLFSFPSFSQQEPLTGFYWRNYSFYNPAMGGVENKHEGNAIYRSNWDKVNGAPRTLSTNYGMNIADNHGVGMNYRFETSGNTRIHQVKANYNLQLKLKSNRKFVLGTAVGYQNLDATHTWNPPSTNIDPLLPVTNTDIFGVDVGAAYFGENLVAGISATQLTIYRSSSYHPTPHLFGNIRYHLHMSPNPYYIILETQLRTDLVAYSQDFNIGFNWNELIEARVGYRTSDAVIVSLAGTLKEKFRIGYIYEITTNKLSSVSLGTHELSVGFYIPNN